MKGLFTTVMGHLLIITSLIGLYFILMCSVSNATTKIGQGDFVMAVSYTDSYKDLQYVANFVNCDHALIYYQDNCAPQGATIMMCQLEQYLYMPLEHVSDDSTFDFDPTDRQSCGFVGVQQPKLYKD
mgnify:FL=1|tara:strand:+ start:977 stop:1357 length:381 start_codon:yes stop_codon:yes gene_type:complete